ncbi:MAG: GtrA family protein [Betaproteobacteria bacterium]|nr:GtrA family protein [Betaproteobacteria bacterium]
MLISGFGLLSTVANAIAFVLATIVSYTVNTLWSFSSNPDRRNMLRFLIVALIGCFLTVAVSAAAQSLGLHYLYGIGLITLIVPPTTFLLHRYWTYR